MLFIWSELQLCNSIGYNGKFCFLTDVTHWNSLQHNNHIIVFTVCSYRIEIYNLVLPVPEHVNNKCIKSILLQPLMSQLKISLAVPSIHPSKQILASTTSKIDTINWNSTKFKSKMFYNMSKESTMVLTPYLAWRSRFKSELVSCCQIQVNSCVKWIIQANNWLMSIITPSDG